MLFLVQYDLQKSSYMGATEVLTSIYQLVDAATEQHAKIIIAKKYESMSDSYSTSYSPQNFEVSSVLTGEVTEEDMERFSYL